MNILKQLFLHDGLRKAFALLLALILYYGILSGISEEKVFNDVPVNITLADGLWGNVQDIKTKITVKGSASTLKELTSGDFAAKLEVNRNHLVGGNSYSVELKPSMFTHPRSVKIKKCGSINLTLDTIIKRQIPVEVKYTGSLNKNYSITNSTATPASVTVEGPENLVNAMTHIDTSKIPLSETVFDSFDFNTKLAPQSEIKIVPQEILVKTSIARKFGERTFKGIPVLLLANSSKLDISFVNAATVDVVVSGPPYNLAGLMPEHFKPYVDASKITSQGTKLLAVDCFSEAEGVTVKSVFPQKIEVKATEK